MNCTIRTRPPRPTPLAGRLVLVLASRTLGGGAAGVVLSACPPMRRRPPVPPAARLRLLIGRKLRLSRAERFPAGIHLRRRVGRAQEAALRVRTARLVVRVRPRALALARRRTADAGPAGWSFVGSPARHSVGVAGLDPGAGDGG